MKKILPILLIIVLIVAGGMVLVKKANQTPPPVNEETPTPITSNEPYSTPTSPLATPTVAPGKTLCSTADLEATEDLEPGAGNVFGTLMIKNISKSTCSIPASSYIVPQFVAKNITVSKQASVGQATLILAPGKTAYSQIHFPNGPQCSAQTVSGNISFTYPISATESVTFKDQTGETQQSINLCQSASEKTQVDVWSLFDKPVNQ